MARVIEEKILDVFFSGDKKAPFYVLSKRDIVRKYLDGSASYFLWGTEIVRKDCYGNIFLFPSSFISYGGSTCPPVSQTTRSRLNAFVRKLLKTGRFCQKNWELYFGNCKIETDSWYKLDRENERLVKEN